MTAQVPESTYPGLAKVPAVRAQIVIWHNPLAQVWRLMWGLAAADRHARAAELTSGLELALGDCSQSPFPDHDIQDLSAHGREAGLSALSYEFFDQNLGHSGGQNRLAQQAQTEILLLVNPDTYPSPTLLVELVKALRDPKIGIAEARQIPLEHPKAFDERTGDTGWASGCCMAIPRRVFESVGGFSPEYFSLHCDDVDLSWRVSLAGLRVVHVPTATVFHDKRLQLNGYPRTSQTETYHSTLGRLLLTVRYSNPQVRQRTMQHIEAHGTEEQRNALLEFRRRQSEGSLPAPLPGGERVARFINGEYAEHRF